MQFNLQPHKKNNIVSNKINKISYTLKTTKQHQKNLKTQIHGKTSVFMKDSFKLGILSTSLVV